MRGSGAARARAARDRLGQLAGQALARRRIAQRLGDRARGGDHVRDPDDGHRQHGDAELGEAPHRREGAPVREPHDEVGAQRHHRLGARVEEAADPRERRHLGRRVEARDADQPVDVAEREDDVRDARRERDDPRRSRRGGRAEAADAARRRALAAVRPRGAGRLRGGRAGDGGEDAGEERRRRSRAACDVCDVREPIRRWAQLHPGTEARAAERGVEHGRLGRSSDRQRSRWTRRTRASRAPGRRPRPTIGRTCATVPERSTGTMPLPWIVTAG